MSNNLETYTYDIYPYHIYDGTFKEKEKYRLADKELVFKTKEDLSRILNTEFHEDLLDLNFNVVEFANWEDHQHVPLRFKHEQKNYLDQLLNYTEMKMAYLVLDIYDESGNIIKIRFNSSSACCYCDILGVLFEKVKTA